MARTHGHGNPNWSRDETILALNLYFQCGQESPDASDKRVVELSNLLRRLPFHTATKRTATFRNPDGVAFKLQNLRNVATGRGLGNVSRIDRETWEEFGARAAAVALLARDIRQGAEELSEFDHDNDFNDAAEFVEGSVITRLHKWRERAPRLREMVLKGRPTLVCEMCQRRSPTTDPDLEDAAFEVHHIVPLSQSLERRTRVSDLALLCAGCHRILHRAISIRRHWIDMREATTLVRIAKENK
jgi:5-methylcytosine-specific restriction protein A